MASCVVCLKDSLPCIYVDSNEWQICNIRPIIEKYLWWWHLKQSPSTRNSYICKQCWEMLSSFHSFFLEVKKMHQQDDEEKWSILKRPIEGNNCDLIENSENLNERPQPDIAKKNFIICIANNNEIIQLLPSSQKDTSNSTLDDADVQGSKVYELKDDTALEFQKDDVGNYTCDISEIQEIYKSKRVSARENNKYLAEKSYQLFCNLCNCELSNFTVLKYHYRKVHDVTGYALCCNKKFYNRDVFADHLRVHENPDYFKCILCTRILCHRLSYEKHMKVHIQSKEKAQTCINCKKTLYPKEDYELHRLFRCQVDNRKSTSSQMSENNTNSNSNNIEAMELPSIKNDVEIFDNPFIESINNEPLTNNSLDCSIASQITDTIEHLSDLKSENCGDNRSFELFTTEQRNYVSISKNIEANEKCLLANSDNDKILSNDAFIDESSKSSNNNNENTIQTTEQINHPKSHYKISCNICGKNFDTEAGLLGHQSKVHIKEMQKEQICPFCSKVSPNMPAHRRHVRYNHVMDFKHVCHICGTKYKWGFQLQEHISMHTGIARYSCTYCSQPFKRLSNMFNHRKSKHPKEFLQDKIKKQATKKLKVKAWQNFLKNN